MEKTLDTIAFTGLEQQRTRLRSEILERIARVVDHGQYIMGPEVRELETRLAEMSGARHAIAVANGTDALQIALMAGGIGRGDAVLVPSFTYTATAEAILILGATPVFVEVDKDSFNIDVEGLEPAFRNAVKDGLRPRAAIGVDLFGLPADWDSLEEFALQHDLFLVRDAAQSFGARDVKKRSVGKCKAVTTTSFFPAKPLGCYGDGGAIFCNDDGLAETMKSIRVHGQGKEKYDTVRVGMNSRLDTLQAAILLAKLGIFEEEISLRNRVAATYSAKLASTFDVPKKPDGTISAWAQYTLKVENRDSLQQALRSKGVPTAIYYPKPMHLQSAYAQYGAGPGSLAVSEQLSEVVLSLPMNPYASEAEVEYICQMAVNAKLGNA